MPHLYNDILVVTKDELIPSFWANYNALKVYMHRDSKNPNGIKRVQYGGKNRQLLISFDSLPVRIKKQMEDPRTGDHPVEMFYQVDAEAVRFYGDFKYPDGSFLKKASQEKYILNASVLNACEALTSYRYGLRKTANMSTRSLHQDCHYDVLSFNEVLLKKHNTKHTLPTSYRRFKQSLNAFQDSGYVSLIKDASGRSKQNARKVTEAVNKLLNDLFGSQKNKPTATEVARQYEAFLTGYLEVVNNDTGEIYSPKEFAKISKTTIKGYLAQWQNKIGTHAKRSGDRQVLMQKFKPHHQLKQPHFAGSLLSIDDRQPPFEYAKGQRVWFYKAIDLASGAFVCWVHGKTKEGIIADFYRQLIRNYHEWGLNLPDGLECESSLNSTYKNTLLREGAMFQNVRIEANNARGKRIEAWFRIVRHNVEKKLDGWIARPFAKSESAQANSEKRVIVPYKKIVNQTLHYIQDWNNSVHNSDKTISKWDYFINNQNPNLKPTNYKGIIPHIGYRTVTSCNAGTINLQNGQFLIGSDGEVALGETLIDLMKKVEGETFEIFWLDDNQGKVFKAFIYMADRFICEAVHKPIYHRAKIEQTEEDARQREIMSAYVATIESYQKSKKNAIDDLTIIDNRKHTISTSFKMPGLEQYDNEENSPSEELPAINDDVMSIQPNTSFIKPLKDRL